MFDPAVQNVLIIYYSEDDRTIETSVWNFI